MASPSTSNGTTMDLDSPASSSQQQQQILLEPPSPSTQRMAATLVSGASASPAPPPAPSSTDVVVLSSPPRSPQTSKQAATCAKVLAEIVQTERLYLANLQAVVDFYVKPLQQPQAQTELAIKPSHLTSIFANLEMLVSFHAILYEELNNCLERVPPQEQVAAMAGLFSKYGDFLRMVRAHRAQRAVLATPAAICLLLVLLQRILASMRFHIRALMLTLCHCLCLYS